MLIILISPPKQSHAEDHIEQIVATGGEDHRWGTGRLQSRQEHHRAHLQPTNPLWDISPAPARPLPCLHGLKKVFDNISTNPIRVIKNHYDKASRAVLFNSSIGDWFRTTVRIRQGCLLSPTLFNRFLEMIMTDALEVHEGTVSMGGRTITNFGFADDIDGLAERKRNW